MCYGFVKSLLIALFLTCQACAVCLADDLVVSVELEKDTVAQGGYAVLWVTYKNTGAAPIELPHAASMHGFTGYLELVIASQNGEQIEQNIGCRGEREDETLRTIMPGKSCLFPVIIWAERHGGTLWCAEGPGEYMVRAVYGRLGVQNMVVDGPSAVSYRPYFNQKVESHAVTLRVVEPRDEYEIARREYYSTFGLKKVDGQQREATWKAAKEKHPDRLESVRWSLYNLISDYDLRKIELGPVDQVLTAVDALMQKLQSKAAQMGTYSRLGELYMRRERFEEAIVVLQKEIDLNEGTDAAERAHSYISWAKSRKCPYDAYPERDGEGKTRWHLGQQFASPPESDWLLEEVLNRKGSGKDASLEASWESLMTQRGQSMRAAREEHRRKLEEEREHPSK